MIEGFVRLMNSGDDCTGPVNLGNPGEVTIGDLAKRIIALTGSRSELVYKPLPSDDPVRRCPDITRAKQSLGWEPKVQLEEGLNRTIAYFADLLGRPRPVRAKVGVPKAASKI
jgi:UDP-glucuronate decarboxylase